jgi:hypothetical protein
MKKTEHNQGFEPLEKSCGKDKFRMDFAMYEILGRPDQAG